MTALVSYLCVIVGMFILTLDLRAQCAMAVARCVVVSVRRCGAGLQFVQSEGPWVGLMRRLLISAISGWLILVALPVRSNASAEQTITGSKDGLKSASG